MACKMALEDFWKQCVAEAVNGTVQYVSHAVTPAQQAMTAL